MPRRVYIHNIQKQILIEQMEHHYQLLFGHRPSERRERNQKWAELAQELNAVPSGSQKRSDEWRICFNQMRSRVEDKLKTCLQNQTTPPSKSEPAINEWDQRIARICFGNSLAFRDIMDAIIPAGVPELKSEYILKTSGVRAINILHKQKSRLIAIMESEYRFLHGPDPRAFRQRADKWTAITAELNAMSNGRPKESSEYRTCFTNMRLTLEDRLQNMRTMFEQSKPMGMMTLSECDLQMARICFPDRMDEIDDWVARTPAITAAITAAATRKSALSRPSQIKSDKNRPDEAVQIPSSSRASQIPRDVVLRGRAVSTDRAKELKSEFVPIKTEPDNWEIEPAFDTDDPAALTFDPAETVLVPEFHAVETGEGDHTKVESIDPLDLGEPETSHSAPLTSENQQTEPQQLPRSVPQLALQINAIHGGGTMAESEQQTLIRIGRRLRMKQTELMRKRKFAALRYKEGLQVMKKRQTELEAIVFGR